MHSFLRASLVLISMLLAGATLGETVDKTASKHIPKSNVEELGVLKTVEKQEAAAEAKATCAADEHTFCFQNGRFAVQVGWKDFSGATGVGTRVQLAVPAAGR